LESDSDPPETTIPIHHTLEPWFINTLIPFPEADPVVEGRGAMVGVEVGGEVGFALGAVVGLAGEVGLEVGALVGGAELGLLVGAAVEVPVEEDAVYTAGPGMGYELYEL